MSGNVHVTPLGVLIAILFAVSMGGLLLWMLRVPRHIPAAAAKARRSVGAIKKILVPTIGAPYSERGVELACRLGQEQKAQIILTYVIEVPRTLPLNAPIPDAENNAKTALQRAQEIVSLRGLDCVVSIDRARVAGEEIIRSSKENDVDVIVIGLKPKLSGTTVIGQTAEILLRKAPCEVIIDRWPSDGI
jgi:nucleotide-binding universal stress UspA family protein